MTLLLDDPRAATTRRGFLTGGLALTALLAGCGGDGGDDRPLSAAPTSAGPVEITHVYGTTRVPGPVSRVAVVGYTEGDTVLALGQAPVLVRSFYGGYPYATGPWADDRLGGARPALMQNESINVEQVASVRPDLVVGTYSGMTRQEYDQLSRIAPTLPQSGDVIEFGMSWQDQLRSIALAMGQSARGAGVLAGVEGRFAAARAAHPELAGRSVVLASTESAGSDFYVFASQDPRARLLADLGLVVPPAIDRLAGEEYGASLSRERGDLLEADVLVFTGPAKGGDAVLRDPVYRNLDVVREGRAVYVEGLSELDVALNYGTPLSIPYVVDQLLPRLAGAVARRGGASAP